MEAIFSPRTTSIYESIVRFFRRWYLRTFVIDVPKVGDIINVAVLERHWDEARIRCSSTDANGLPNPRSSHCVIAQALAEVTGFGFASVGGGGEGTLYNRELGIEVSLEPTDERAGRLVRDFDWQAPTAAREEELKPTVWPYYVQYEVTRVLNA